MANEVDIDPPQAGRVGRERFRESRSRKPTPYARRSRAEAKRVGRVLERHCDFPIPVEPVLVFVGVTELKAVVTQLDVRVYQERQVSALAPLSGVLTADQVEQVYSFARHRQAWNQA
ncbi:hypothetical protein ACF1B0_16245 [Streptomyces anandii]|uniref:hypothetical protein n=1 Tax=Streptomyces anandii TaxID=285454 RepID=UPI003700CE3E